MAPDPQDEYTGGIPPRPTYGGLLAQAQQERQQAPSAGELLPGLPGARGAPSATSTRGGLDDLGQMLAGMRQQNQGPPSKLGGWAHGLAATGAEAAGAIASGLKTAGEQVLGNNVTSAGLGYIRNGLYNFAQSQQDKLSPEEQDRLQRQWTSLDPSNTAWQGGVGSVAHTAVSQLINTLGPIVLARNSPLFGVMAAGQISDSIEREVQGKPNEQLVQDPHFAKLLAQGMGYDQARQAYTQELQGIPALMGGALTGIVAHGVGALQQPLAGAGGALRRTAAGALTGGMRVYPHD